jgi:hypothetical protein
VDVRPRGMPGDPHGGVTACRYCGANSFKQRSLALSRWRSCRSNSTVGNVQFPVSSWHAALDNLARCGAVGACRARHRLPGTLQGSHGRLCPCKGCSALGVDQCAQSRTRRQGQSPRTKRRRGRTAHRRTGERREWRTTRARFLPVAGRAVKKRRSTCRMENRQCLAAEFCAIQAPGPGINSFY